MIVIEGKGTISVTEPGHSEGTYYEDAQIWIYGGIVHFIAYHKHKTAGIGNCLIGWDAPPTIRDTGGAE